MRVSLIRKLVLENTAEMRAMRMVVGTIYWLSRYAVVMVTVRAIHTGHVSSDAVLFAGACVIGTNGVLLGLLKDSGSSLPKGVHIVSLSRWEYYVYFSVV